MTRIPLSSAGFLIALVALSCGRAGPTLHPVRGSVVVDGRPAEGATVILEPTGNTGSAVTPTGVVATDGTFTLQSPTFGAGAPAGEYTVLISWFPDDARSSFNTKNKLPARYSDRAATPIPKVTVSPGDNQLPQFELSAK